MFVFLVLGLILCQQVVPNIGSPARVARAETELNKTFSGRPTVPGVAGLYNYAVNQTMHINSPLICFPSDLASGNNPPITHAPEVVSVFEVYNPRVTWNEARQTCIDKGGHLAIIRSDSEAESIKQSMVEKSVVIAWVGYHDLFMEGSFVTVLDEPMANTGWTRWWTSVYPNPDNVDGNQNCVALTLHDGIGLDDDSCNSQQSYICQIQINS